LQLNYRSVSFSRTFTAEACENADALSELGKWQRLLRTLKCFAPVQWLIALIDAIGLLE